MNRKNKNPNLLASERFLRSYYKASPNLQHLAEGAVHDLVRKYRSNPATLLHQYGKLKGRKSRIMEVDISGAPRLLADYFNGTITLLEMGNHETPGRYDDRNYVFDLGNASAAPDHFFPEQKSNFFLNSPDPTISCRYSEELSSEWLYFLENQQAEVYEELLEMLIYAQNSSAFIIGGPGTGKTCILLNILKYLAELNICVGISLSDNLTQFIERTTRADISSYRINLNYQSSVEVLIIDDPSYKQLNQAIALKKLGKVKMLVAAFDPLQLDKMISYQEFNKIVYDNKIKVHQLNQCYRQKENLGKNTKRIVDVIAASTPLAAEHKIKNFHSEHKKLTELSNNLEFVNPNGYIQIYEDASLEDIQKETNRIWVSKELMWNHSEGLLIILDELDLIQEAKNIFKKFERINYAKIISGNRINEIKGLEFQHVFIFLNKSLFDELQTAFKSTGTAVYHKRRLLRIPFSRAKDSLVTFAL